MRSRSTVFIFFCLTLFSALVYAQTAPTLTVEGEVLRPLNLSASVLSKFKQIEITAKDKDGKEHVYTGVKLYDVLDSAGVTLGGKLRGENLAKYVLVKAADGYEVTFALPEIDPEFTDQVILLALKVDGSPLKSGEGPFRMVVPKDKKHARWIREIKSIKVLFPKD